jgi:serine phosphatase RsbU (regulator of sigma subunit)
LSPLCRWLSPAAAYQETAFTLPENGRLTLMTDGVIEAMSLTGELFGFDRAARLSHKPAEKIARAAQEFGQEDDITVLTLTRELSPVVVA